MKRRWKSAVAALAAIAAIGSLTGVTTYAADSVSITNVSFDPTRELYEQYNKIFQEHWKEKTGQDVDITQSHGGSGKQALEVANGLEADVVTLALEYDVDAIQDAGLIDDGWVDEFPEDSSPYTSTIVFLVRKGNPKNIKDWDDLVKKDVGVITPNPKTSGGARWNYLAAWAYAKDKYNGDEDKIKEFIGDLYKNVLVLDTGARGATTSFVENGQGDVLIAWENEAFLSVRDNPDDYEIVTPSISILAQPSVAVVDENVKKHDNADAAKAYLKYLYSDEAQELIAENYYRPVNQTILKKHPSGLLSALRQMSDTKDLVREVSLGGKTIDGNSQFFYALIAMACLYGCFIGFGAAITLQANLTALAARRCVTPTHKLKLILSEQITSFLLGYTDVIILLIYLRIILKLDFQGQIGKMLIISLFGSLIGVSVGLFVGSLGKLSEGIKVAVILAISMVCSFLAGLMNSNMKDLVEKHAPIINRINPAALISDAFYCINVYDDTARYYRSLATLAVMCVVLVMASFFMVRRERYDSI